MQAFLRLIWLAILALIVICGCSTGNSPVQPQPTPQAGSSGSIETESQRSLWGIWDISIDLEALSATIIPSRNNENHFNVLPFLKPPKCTDCLKFHINSFDNVTRILDIDVTLRNKFSVAGYDVRGILFTNDIGHSLLNPDNWIELFDVPGGGTVNPFIAFAKGEPQRKFSGMGQFTENYRIYVPDPPQYIKLKYAVDASYPSNCVEPYTIDNFTCGAVTSDVGSHGTVSVEVKDWQGDVNMVKVYVPSLYDNQLVLTHQSGDTWTGELVNVNGAFPSEYIAEIIATSAGSSTVALFDYLPVSVVAAGEGGWARTWGGTSLEGDVARAVASDGDGNVYVTGSFSGTSVDFNPDPSLDDVHSSIGSMDIFLSKYNSSGALLWARTWGGDFPDHGNSIAVDSAGNTYIAGSFCSDVDFNPDPTMDDFHSSNGSKDVFLSKFDSNGTYQWVRTWGGSDPIGDGGLGVDLDGSGNIFVTGDFTGGAVDFNPDAALTDLHSSLGFVDMFLSKFDSSGTFEWARTWGGNSEDHAFGVAADGSGNAHVTGFFTGASVDFDPDPVASDPHSSNGLEDIFVSKFDSTGTFVWARTWGGSWGETSDFGYGVAVDVSSNVYVTGQFGGPDVDFDPDPVGVDQHSSNGYDSFLSKFDSSGTLDWAHIWGGITNDSGFGVKTDTSGDVYITGQFSGTSVDFNPDSTEDDLHSTNGGFDIFLTRFDSSGSFVWTRTWGGSAADDGTGVDIDGSGNVFVSGSFSGIVDFNPDATQTDPHTSNGQFDAFVSKFKSDGTW